MEVENSVAEERMRKIEDKEKKLQSQGIVVVQHGWYSAGQASPRGNVSPAQHTKRSLRYFSRILRHLFLDSVRLGLHIEGYS